MAAISARPDLADSYQSMGNVALAEKQFREAEKNFRIAISKGQKLPQVLNNLGIALAEQGDLQGAINAFHMALEAQPNMAQAQKNLLHYTAKLPQNNAP
jgi:Tfp pilus assembly protein PilF